MIRAINRYRGGDKVAVDVIGLGMRRRTTRGYMHLAKKTGGLFLMLANPAKLDRALARYRKALQKRAMEKIEIRGENVVFTVNPGEEIISRTRFLFRDPTACGKAKGLKEDDRQREDQLGRDQGTQGQDT